MGWCPKCRVEYVAGITVCADCGSTLAEELAAENQQEELPEAFLSRTLLSEDELQKLVAQKSRAGQSAWEEEFAATLESLAEDPEGTKLRERIREEAASQMAAKMRTQPSGVYRNSGERAEEHRSSAYTLLVVGGAGLVAVVLFFFGILPIPMETFSKYMISGVMGVLFILFLVMGVISMKNSKVLAKKAGKENNLTREIKAWCKEHIDPEQLDGQLFRGQETVGEEELGEELKYFRRFEKIREVLSSQFLNLEEGYLERLIDEIYPELFEQEPEDEG